MAMIDIAEATRAINSKNRVAFHHFHHSLDIDLTQSPIKRAIFQKAELRELVIDERADMVFDFCFDLGSVDQTVLSDGDVPAVPCLEGAMPSGLIPEHVSVEVTP